MANWFDISMTISAVDEATKAIEQVKKELAALEKQADKTVKWTKKWLDTSAQIEGYWAIAAAWTAAFLSIWFAANQGKIALEEYESITIRLKSILQTSRGASDEQVKSLVDYAEALELTWVAWKESIVNTMAQLATFDLEAETIRNLTPAILDYVVAEKWASATAEDYKNATNWLAQALNWNFASLTKVWFVLDENTKEMISNWTESQRSAAIVDVLNSTYKGFNSTMLQTSEGMRILREREVWELQENIAIWLAPAINLLQTAFLSIITVVNDFIEENKLLAEIIIVVVTSITAVLSVLWIIWFVLPAITAWVYALWAAFKFLTANPIWALILAISLIIIWLYAIWRYLWIIWDTDINVWLNADWITWKLDWARAKWWTVWGNWTYLVWEEWPELFVPSMSWRIIPNNELWNWKSWNVVINMWWVVVNNEADENRLVNKIKDLLIREKRLSNNWLIA